MVKYGNYFVVRKYLYDRYFKEINRKGQKYGMERITVRKKNQRIS